MTDNLTTLPADLVEQTVDDGHATVEVRLYEFPDLLPLLARAVWRNLISLRAFEALGEHGIRSPRGVSALALLLDDPAVRDALTVRISVTDAEDWAEALTAAAVVRTCDKCDVDIHADTHDGLCGPCGIAEYGDEDAAYEQHKERQEWAS